MLKQSSRSTTSCGKNLTTVLNPRTFVTTYKTLLALRNAPTLPASEPASLSMLTRAFTYIGASLRGSVSGCFAAAFRCTFNARGMLYGRSSHCGYSLSLPFSLSLKTLPCPRKPLLPVMGQRVESPLSRGADPAAATAPGTCPISC